MVIEDLGLEAEHWAAAVTDSYEQSVGVSADGLRKQVVDTVRVAMMIGLEPDEWPSRINWALERWEDARGLDRGPRVAGIDAQTGDVWLTDP